MQHLESLNAAAWEQLSGQSVAPVTINMPGLNVKKQSGSVWYSEPFYTHAHGYKMQSCVDVNGWFSHVHIALELYIMKGPNPMTTH